jgi:protein-tyrosine phosphatase
MSVRIISLCTGNAARSVMLGALLRDRRPDLEVVTAGTHVVDGQPISRRTRAGLAAIGLAADDHRSRQLDPADLPTAAVVIGMAHEHVRWMRRHHPEAARRTAMLRPLSRELVPGPPGLGERVAALDLTRGEPDPADDVADPAGGEDEDYVRCALELAQLVARLAPRL